MSFNKKEAQMSVFITEGAIMVMDEKFPDLKKALLLLEKMEASTSSVLLQFINLLEILIRFFILISSFIDITGKFLQVIDKFACFSDLPVVIVFRWTSGQKKNRTPTNSGIFSAS